MEGDGEAEKRKVTMRDGTNEGTLYPCWSHEFQKSVRNQSENCQKTVSCKKLSENCQKCVRYLSEIYQI